MVAAACALRVLGAGLHSFGFTVFFLPLSQDLDLNRTSTSLAFSLARAEGAIEGPIVGHLLDRYGPKPIMLAAVLLMGVGYLLLSQVNSYATFLIVYLGVISLAHAGGFMHAPMVLINTWFIRHRARAITISSAAFGMGGVLLAPILSVIVQAWGWRWGAAIAGVFFLVIGIPLCLTIRRSPESMGLLPDGDEPVSSADGEDGASADARTGSRCHRGRSSALVCVLGIGAGGGYSQRLLPCDFGSFHPADGLERAQPSRGGFATECLCVSRHGGDACAGLVCRQGEQAALDRDTFFFAAAAAMFLPIFQQLPLVAVAVHDFLCRGGNHFPAGLGGGRRSFRQKALRQDSRLYGFVLHLGRSSRSGDCRRDLRPVANLRAALMVPGCRVHPGGSVLRKSQSILAESDGSDTRGRLSSLQLTEVMHPQATIKGSTLQIEDNGPVPWRACKILIRYPVNNSSARPSTLIVIEPGFRSWNRQRREAQPFRSEVDGFSASE